jgi:upstream activation factor subunit UAF30
MNNTTAAAVNTKPPTATAGTKKPTRRVVKKKTTKSRKAPAKKTTPKPKATKTKAPVTPKPATETTKPAAESKPAAETPKAESKTEQTTAEAAAAPTASDEFKAVEETLRDFSKLCRALEKKVRNARRLHEAELKEAKKYQKKLKDANRKKRAPSGIAKPERISKELAAFLEVDPETEISRIDATRKINAYIRKHNLQNPQDRRKIICDDKLMALLNPEPNEEVNFFNLQTLMKKHYVKSNKTSAATTSAVTATPAGKK